jgi:predicted transcriptional regulator
MTKTERDMVCRELRSPKTNKEIARKLNVHPMTISHWRKKFRIQRFISKEECRAHIIALAVKCPDGVYQSEMVNACECSRQKIYWILKELEQEGYVYPLGNTTNRKWFLQCEVTNEL